ncbi:MAG: hypothetical protein LBL41_04710 [Bifidobacteriaceae bacterium]|jgi:hypothetical protein|nr:hypothetical protein [Bifidobacteriaceae bacterium]
MERDYAIGAVRLAVQLPAKAVRGVYNITSVMFNQLVRRDKDLIRIREGIDALERHEIAPQDAKVAELYDLVYVKIAEDKKAGKRAKSVKLPR